jgi:hypothetical protein
MRCFQPDLVSHFVLVRYLMRVLCYPIDGLDRSVLELIVFLLCSRGGVYASGNIGDNDLEARTMTAMTKMTAMLRRQSRTATRRQQPCNDEVLVTTKTM